MTRTQASPPRSRTGRVAIVLAALAGLLLIWAQVGGGWESATRVLERVRTSDYDGPLLVNADHGLPDGYEKPELVELVDRIPVAHAGVAVAADIEQPLLGLFADARAAGLKNLYLISGYRSAEEQQELWENSSDRSYVQPAGHSEHQTGLAVDFGDTEIAQGKFGKSEAGRWLAQNAWTHGFILRYPAGKEAVTGISYEPWHFRYVGEDVAATCHDLGITLEEYAAGHTGASARA